MIIAGDGESMPALQKLVSERGLGEVVEFTGWLDGSAVDELLRSATVAIQPDLPTRMNDLSTMAKTVEYLGRGVPVVAADLVETRRSAGDAAVYVTHATPGGVRSGHRRPARRFRRGGRRMREVGLARFAETLAWDHQATRYLTVWSEAVGNRGSPSRRRRTGADRGRCDPTSRCDPTRWCDQPADAAYLADAT